MGEHLTTVSSGKVLLNVAALWLAVDAELQAGEGAQWLYCSEQRVRQHPAVCAAALSNRRPNSQVTVRPLVAAQPRDRGLEGFWSWAVKGDQRENKDQHQQVHFSLLTKRALLSQPRHFL